MRIILYVALVLFLSHCGSQTETDIKDTQNTELPPPHPNEVSESPQPLVHVIEGQNSVTKNSEYYASGLMAGTFLKASERGNIINTKEVEISLGTFPGTSYIGQIIEMSIDDNDEKIFNQLLQLDTQQVYVFEYKQPHWSNPEIEDTKFHILSASPLNEQFGLNHTGVIKASPKKTGSYSTGERRGKIIEVKRWGFEIDIDCSFKLHVGGLNVMSDRKDNNDDKKPPEDKTTPMFNVYSEEGCLFAEEVLKAGKNVIVKYSQDYVEWWDEHTRIAEEITLAN